MDFGVVSRKHTSPNASCLGSNEPRDRKAHRSANLKHQRSGLAEDNNTNSWRLFKMPSEVDFSSKKCRESFISPFGRSNLWPSPDDEDGQKMLSFSSDEPRRGGGGGSSRSIAFSICEDEQFHSRMGGGGPTGGNRGPFARLKGPFTPSQWMELEHQALIYKHIMANVPVPSNLLVPLKRSIYSYGPYASNLLGWGPFHIGYSGSNDPEPGRCRRTDGKKWRCSRDAVPEQKYCERHINRGRHRSRKPVEGHNTVGHANANANANVSSSNKVPLIPIHNASSCSSSAPVMSATNASPSNNSLSAMQCQFDSLQQQPNSANNLVSRTQGFQGLSLVPPTIGLKPKDVLLSVQKQQATFQESSSSSPNSEFGIVSSDSLLNPSERIIPYMNSNTNTNTSDSFLQFNSKETRDHNHSVHHFIDDWPKADHHQSEELKSDWTQLSMSIPTGMAAPDSPTQAKPISSLRLSHELDPFHMSLGMSRDFINEPIQKQPAWLPVTWGNPMGGPLGEVLSSQIGSSPTGVLQKSTFVSFSNSSSVSSPTSVDNRKSDLLGTALMSSIPTL